MSRRTQYKQYAKIAKSSVLLLIEARRYGCSADKLFRLEQSIYDILLEHPSVLNRSYQREPLVRSNIIHCVYRLGERLESNRKDGIKSEILDKIIEDELDILAIMIDDYIKDCNNEHKQF